VEGRAELSNDILMILFIMEMVLLTIWEYGSLSDNRLIYFLTLLRQLKRN
jgi:hypothetical protein